MREKAHHPNDPSLPDEERGLGWSAASAQGLVDDLVWGVIDKSNGDTVGILTIPQDNPPLSHEDGMVYRTAHTAADEEIVDCMRYCVTNDKPFRNAALNGWARVLYPAEFLNYVRGSRRAISTAAILKPQRS